MTQLRAVIYARYSSDLQREASIEDQARLCRERAATENWSVIETYFDQAQSGSTRFRSRYQQLLVDAQSGNFDVVIAEGLDRLSRDQEDVAGLFKTLQFHRIQLITLSEGVITELHVGLKGTMNALFLKDLAAKTHRGLRGRVEAGRSAGSISFGYRIAREFDTRGEPVRGGREIEPSEANVIRRIFEMFAAGRSPRSITRELNSECVPGPGGRQWRDTTIRGHAARGTGILRNELYVGKLVWNRQSFVRDPRTGKRLSRPNPKDQWIIEDVPELRIIPQDLWDKVAARFQVLSESPAAKAIKSSQFWLKRRPRHLLTGLVRCGTCGAGMAAVGKDYLRCGSADRNAGCSSTRRVRRSLLESVVIDSLRSNLMAPEIVAEFISEVHLELTQQRAQLRVERIEMGKRLRKVEEQLDSLVTAIAEGFRAATLQSSLDALEAEKLALSAKLRDPETNVIELQPNLSALYKRKVETLQDTLNSPEQRDQALTILRGLIEEVLIWTKDGNLEVELVGNIASMVEIATPENASAAPEGAALSAALRRSVKVVAGRGFEPLTFRL